MAFELSTPIVFFLRGRAYYLQVALMYAFHLMVFVAVTISFIPHLVAMTSFLPLERLRPLEWLRRRLSGIRRSGVPEPESAAPG
jgi:pilus assembly protein TadC